MKCQFCDIPATVHLTDLSNKKKREMHLCEECARRHNLIPDQSPPQIDLKALLSFLSNSIAAVGAGFDTTSLICPTCGLQYGEFRAEGRLGCPDEYDAFRPALEPLLERIHRSSRHHGKIPRAARAMARAAELDSLREQLKAAIAAEQYEDAAHLRDLLRQRESTDESR